MKYQTFKIALLAAVTSLAFSIQVSADHNSIWGESWANMPNDIHNTVVEDDLNGRDFMEFISGGAGADSVNRYADDNSNGNGGGNGGGSGGGMGGGNGGGNGNRGGRG